MVYIPFQGGRINIDASVCGEALYDNLGGPE